MHDKHEKLIESRLRPEHALCGLGSEMQRDPWQGNLVGCCVCAAESSMLPLPAKKFLRVGVGKTLQARQVESALGLWRQMAASGTTPTVDNCNALLTACIDCDQGERALDIYRSMKDLGVRSERSLNAAIIISASVIYTYVSNEARLHAQEAEIPSSLCSTRPQLHATCMHASPRWPVGHTPVCITGFFCCGNAVCLSIPSNIPWALPPIPRRCALSITTKILLACMQAALM